MNYTVNAPQHDMKVSVPGWAVAFCAELKTTAFVGGALIHYFNYWDSIKVQMMRKQMQENEQAILSGKNPPHIIHRLQYHTMPEIQAELLNLASENTILKARQFLEKKKVLSVARNPNPAFGWDRKNYYLFHKEPLQQFIDTVYINSPAYLKIAASYRKVEVSHLNFEASYLKNEVSYLKNEGTITTTSTTNPPTITTTKNNRSVADATQPGKKTVEKENEKWVRLRKRIGKCQTEIFKKNKFEFPFSEKFKLAFIEWLEYKRQKGSVYRSPNSIKRLLKQFGQMNEDYSISLIDIAIGQNYTGVIFKDTISKFQKEQNYHAKSNGSNSEKHAAVAANLGAILNQSGTENFEPGNFAAQ